MDKLILKMPRTESDRDDGINDGNIETYKNTPILSLTKEELQNSTDGADRDETTGKLKKVYVEFNDFYLSKNKFPDYDGTVKVFNNELQYWKDFYQNDEKALSFFKDALDVLKQDKIRCLRISDFNTTGLTGINEKKSPWKNLVKNRGVSDKPSYSGGSFGIGKDAAFACSKLRTVFYSTYNVDSADNKAFQGTIKLPSYQVGEENHDGIGFYSLDDGLTKTNPLPQVLSLDEKYSRDERHGMDKFIVGFDTSLTGDEMKKEIIVSSLNNFLYAFFADKLEVTYSDIVLNKINLDKIFEMYNEDINPLTKEYYETLKNPQKQIYINVFDENDVVIYVTLNPEGNRRAAVIRQGGMKVFDKGNISGRINFSAVIVLLGDKVNGYFKKLENSEHTQWSIERAKDKNEARNYQNKIFDSLRETLKKMHQEEFESTIDADGMSEYLPYAYVSGKRDKVDTLTNEVETKSKARKKRKPKKEEKEEVIYYDLDENGNVDENSIRFGKTDVPNPEPNPNPTPKPNVDVDIDGDGTNALSISENETKFRLKKKISDGVIKYHLINKNSVYKLKFISQEKITAGFLEINISGEQESMSTVIHNATMNDNNLLTKGNKIRIENVNPNEVNEITFSIKQKGDWALEVSANESEK